MIIIAKTTQLVCITLLLMAIITEANAAGTLNERNYKKLQTIHQLIEKNRLIQAKTQIEQFLASKHADYTQAIFLQTAAYIALEQQQYDQAISYLEQADSLHALPDYVSRNIVYNLAQLYWQRDNSKKNDLSNTLAMLERWLALSRTVSHKGKSAKEKISSKQHIFAATVYARNSNYKSAVSHVRQAIKQAGQLSQKPEESWYQLLISLYLQQKKTAQAINTYQTVIKLYPKNKNYWKQLSALYLQIDKPHQALAVMELAKKQAMLVTEEELLRLARLFLYTNIPLSAAQLLQENLNSGVIKPTLKNWQTLADSWIMAQEYDRAIKVLQHLARLDGQSGHYQFRIGRLLMAQGNWLAAFQAFTSAQGKRLKDPGKSYFLQGISGYYAKTPEKAKKAFEQAKSFKKYEKQATIWLQQMN